MISLLDLGFGLPELRRGSRRQLAGLGDELFEAGIGRGTSTELGQRRELVSFLEQCN
jgi:hypothetical protein